jgi:hypothetical protein
MSVLDGNHGAITSLGSISMGKGYASNGSTIDIAATLTMSGSTLVVTLNATDPNAATGASGAMAWTPGAVKDLAGNPLSNAGQAVTESGTPTDREF